MKRCQKKETLACSRVPEGPTVVLHCARDASYQFYGSDAIRGPFNTAGTLLPSHVTRDLQATHLVAQGAAEQWA